MRQFGGARISVFLRWSGVGLGSLRGSRWSVPGFETAPGERGRGAAGLRGACLDDTSGGPLGGAGRLRL